MRLWQATRKLRMGRKLQRRVDYFTNSSTVKPYNANHWGIKLGFSDYQFFFPRIKKELPSGIGTIFSLGPENSGFKGATPAKKKKKESRKTRKV